MGTLLSIVNQGPIIFGGWGHRRMDKVAEVARILDEDGYLADFEALPDGTFLVTERVGYSDRPGEGPSKEDA